MLDFSFQFLPGEYLPVQNLGDDVILELFFQLFHQMLAEHLLLQCRHRIFNRNIVHIAKGSVGFRDRQISAPVIHDTPFYNILVVCPAAVSKDCPLSQICIVGIELRMVLPGLIRQYKPWHTALRSRKIFHILIEERRRIAHQLLKGVQDLLYVILRRPIGEGQRREIIMGRLKILKLLYLFAE